MFFAGASASPGAEPRPALFAGHSLRSGLATAAATAGKSERPIMKQTGHRSVTVVWRYIRDAELFDDNAAAGIGL
jgi:integrase